MEAKTNFRQIIHVDMDAFYASVEQRDDPTLKGLPVVVGGLSSRGVVSAASYEARKFGIHSAMPISEARRRCPQAVFLPVNMAKYRQVSGQIQEIFLDYTPLVEPLSLDEAFLDVTGSISLFGPAEFIASEIKRRIRQELDLTASIGLAGNKFLAKLASDLRKPDGFVVVDPAKVQEFLDPLSITRVLGVGKKTAEKLFAMNIRTVRDLRAMEEKNLTALFGSLGRQLYELARGIDNRPVEAESPVKSIGRETTFAEDIEDPEILEAELLKLSLEVGRRLRHKDLQARTVTLKVRYPDFQTFSRSHTLTEPTDLDDVIYHEALKLLRGTGRKQPLRLIGITLSNLVKKESCQPSLFAESPKDLKALAAIIDQVNVKYGKGGITRARLLKIKNINEMEN